MTKRNNHALKWLPLAALLGFAASAALSTPAALAMGTESPGANPAPKADAKPADAKPKKADEDKRAKTKKDDKKDEKKSETDFLNGYRAARALIVDGHYQEGIAAMHALGRDEHPDVANYIGYANRKLGNYDDSKYWYEKALAAAPDHARTWSYYGMWHAEQGNRLKAEDFLAKVKLICGSADCREYRELREVIDGTASY
jgi:tetratricopeptide (TPR) repeat protein